MKWELVDLRDEIRKYDLEHRPFPPRSGSASKPYAGQSPVWMGWIDAGQRNEYMVARLQEAQAKERSYFRVKLVADEDDKKAFDSGVMGRAWGFEWDQEINI